MKRYLVFIPVFNEESSIRNIISEIRKFAAEVDILVIDDGSTDNTPDILKEIRDIYNIRHLENQGYGKTLIDGFSFAEEKGYDYIITIDSDEQHQPREIKKFIEASRQDDSDILSGSRYIHISPEEKIKAPEDRLKVNSRITMLINKITGYQLTDSFCGFKLYKVAAVNKLRLKEPGYGMPVQLWLQAWKYGLTVNEIPVELIYFDHNPNQTTFWTNTFRRYRYYIQIIQKETERHEYHDFSSASR